MSEKSIKFQERKVNKSNFYNDKTLFKIDDIDVDRILISKKESYGKNKTHKYFTGYNYNDEIEPLFIRLPQMIGYAKFFDSSKTMSFKVNDNKMLKSYTKIWKRISDLMNIKFDSEPVYGDSVKTKIKTYEDRINIIFHDNKMAKQNVSYKCLPVIILDSVIRTNKKYFRQILLKECRYEVKKIIKQKNLLIMTLTQTHLMKVMVSLIVNLIMNLKFTILWI